MKHLLRIVFCSIVLSAPAFAEDDLATRQIPLLEAVNALANEWSVVMPFTPTEGDTPVGPDGYGGLELDLVANQVLLYWKYGTPLPPAVAERVAQIQATGVGVEVLKSPFSLRDLRNEYRLIVAELNADPDHFAVQSVGPLRAGAGIVLTTSDPKKVQSTAFYANSSKRLGSKSKRPPASPVEVRLAASLPILYSSRERDGSPYRGGSRMGESCSLGFSVGRLFEANRYLLTAGHCVSHTNNVAVETGAGLALGTTSKAQSVDRGSLDRIDAVLVGSLNCQSGPGSVCSGLGSSQAQIYVGDVGINEGVRIVKNKTVAVPGMVVCTSGSFSGTRCDIQVEEIEVRQPFAFEAAEMRSLVRAVHRSGLNTSGQGDSGGPVYTPRGITNEVNAAGTIVGGSNDDAACTNIIWTSSGGARKCGRELFFLPIAESLRAADVWLEVQ